VSELHGVIEREKAVIGVLTTMHPPTRAMKVEAATAGFYIRSGASTSGFRSSPLSNC
jgi:hypothetical protein